jgi:hypothetical protein
MYSDSISLQSQTKQSHAQKFDNHATCRPPPTSILPLLWRLNSLPSTMAMPLFFHGLDALLADKIRFHQIEHLAGPFNNATSIVKVASRRINSSFQSTIGRQYKDCPSHESSTGSRWSARPSNPPIYHGNLRCYSNLFEAGFVQRIFICCVYFQWKDSASKVLFG